jgi:hypothetical protein
MYRIIKEGKDGEASKELAIVEKPVFIRMHSNGCFVQAERASAQGIAVNGTPYNLLGAAPLDEMFETAWAVEVNGGEFIQEHQAAIDDMILTILEG